jgi:hypothetical protein
LSRSIARVGRALEASIACGAEQSLELPHAGRLVVDDEDPSGVGVVRHGLVSILDRSPSADAAEA